MDRLPTLPPSPIHEASWGNGPPGPPGGPPGAPPGWGPPGGAGGSPPAGPPAWGPGPGYGPPQGYGAAQGPPPDPNRISALATVSLVCGIVSLVSTLCCIVPFVNYIAMVVMPLSAKAALICGGIELAGNGNEVSRKRAKLGMILGGVGLGLLIVMLVLMMVFSLGLGLAAPFLAPPPPQ